ncbi:Platelet glycoprotein 4, partial [Podiceps cristatus]
DAVIANGTIAFENWIVPGSSVYRQFWVFHVQNPSEVLEQGARPKLEQRGPYTYRESSTELKYIFEIPNHIVARLDKKCLNCSYTQQSQTLSAAPALYKTAFMHILLNVWIKASKSSMLQNRTVKELLWGYKDPFLNKIPYPLDTVLGVFYPYNGTFDGLYKVYTGKEDITKTAIIESYKNKRNLSYWEGYCDLVNGTDGASFPPFVKKDQVLRFFSSDICR